MNDTNSIPKPKCEKCGLRVDRDSAMEWRHLITVAGLEAQQDHLPIVEGGEDQCGGTDY